MAAILIESCTAWVVLSGIGGAASTYFIRQVLSRAASARKEDWDQFNGFCEQVHNLADAATQFYCNPLADPRERKNAAIKIQGMISRTNQAARAFAKTMHDVNCYSYQMRMRQAITLKGFDGDNHEPLALDHQSIKEIEAACVSLVGALRLSYYQRHRPDAIAS